MANDETGAALQAGLKPGQQLVSREGAVWRWDGYTMRAGAPSTAAVRLSQRNRLAEIRHQIDGIVAEQTIEQARVDAEKTWLAAARDAEKTCVDQARAHERSVAEAARRKTQDAGEATRAAERAAQSAIGTAERLATQARDRHVEIARRTDQLRTRLAGIETVVAEALGDIAEVEMRRTFREARLSSISDTQADRAEAGALRVRIAELRAALVEAEGQCDRLARESKMRVERLAQIAQDHEGWSKRLREADGQIVELDARREQTAAAIAELAAKPAEIEEKRMVLGEEIDKAEANRQEAADRLAIGETRLAEADKALRQAETEMGNARESRVRREGLVEQATKDREAVVERIVERLRCEPDGVMALAEVQSLDELPELDKAEHKLERLVHERETMGAVNLRAEEEANELEQQITGMTTERDDLVAAIGRLRQGIQSLNREGRERFLAAFEQVSGHFQQLFTKLFGGGKAELRLTESEDPLEAGLEIHACAAGQEAAGHVAALGRRAGADGTVAAVRGVHDQPGADLRAGRGGRAAGRPERGAFLRPGERHRRPHRHALPDHHPPSRHDGAHGSPLRRDHGRAGRFPARLGQPAGGRSHGGLGPPNRVQLNKQDYLPLKKLGAGWPDGALFCTSGAALLRARPGL